VDDADLTVFWIMIMPTAWSVWYHCRSSGWLTSDFGMPFHYV